MGLLKEYIDLIDVDGRRYSDRIELLVGIDGYRRR